MCDNFLWIKYWSSGYITCSISMMGLASRSVREKQAISQTEFFLILQKQTHLTIFVDNIALYTEFLVFWLWLEIVEWLRMRLVLKVGDSNPAIFFFFFFYGEHFKGFFKPRYATVSCLSFNPQVTFEWNLSSKAVLSLASHFELKKQPVHNFKLRLVMNSGLVK